ncbi:type VI secretion system protein ImpA [Yoonia maricola]|uniref:Type VI secretion system protein ImpA n=1 Tax=Yoonia maricola TaxID=420999 RepID=A0A2M8VZZ8_9RHOB|nr:type VI secretion system ImpA family N-terminal domain-containing protein [Yoonia maricola]PJI84248.1 type VI secretion system protein ImpA [Yoonia maricola]
MSLDWIKTPISEDAPCGIDLWEEDDPQYSDYYFDATDRLPEGDDYVKLGLALGEGAKNPDVIFDPKFVDLKSELGQIDALLQRTRDIRLLVLRTQWCVLAGKIADAATSMNALADLIDAFPMQAFPNLDDGTRDRLDAINDLGAIGAMILPLRYLDIANSGASRRRFMVCNGEATPHDGEDDLSVEIMKADMVALAEEVALEHSALVAFRSAIERIEAACAASPKPHKPQLDQVKAEIDAVLNVIAEANPKLAPETDEKDKKPVDGAPAQANTVAPVQAASKVASHDEARARLMATEAYFGRNEPSSAAVLLVTQARLLIGKTLVDAFDILMPNTAAQAKVDFIADNGFALSHGQLRALADQVQVADTDPAEPADGADMQAQVVPAPVVVNTAAEAVAEMMAVESYFRAVEKSSPIPTLLARARSFVGKDFEALLKELVPPL